jgi:cyclic dehypoxanthinyl futalosine synthase
VSESADLQSVLDRAAAGGRFSPEEAVDIYRGARLPALCAAADAVRRRRYAGTEHIATYIIERNINYTNVCVTACKFCAFYAPPKDTEKGWTRDLDDILRRCEETVRLGGTQIMFQGGHHPDFGVEYYEEHFSAIKKAFPQLVIHSLGASEVEHMARIAGFDPARVDGLKVRQHVRPHAGMMNVLVREGDVLQDGQKTILA